MVELRNIRVVEKGLSLMLQVSLISELRIHTFRIALFIINRLPSKVLDFKTSYELFYDKVDYAFHTMNPILIRCVFLGSCPQPYVAHKMDPISIRCVFLGYVK